MVYPSVKSTTNIRTTQSADELKSYFVKYLDSQTTRRPKIGTVGILALRIGLEFMAAIFI